MEQKVIIDWKIVVALGVAASLCILSGPHVEFCVSEFRQTQEYHVINVHDGGLFPLSTALPVG